MTPNTPSAAACASAAAPGDAVDGTLLDSALSDADLPEVGRVAHVEEIRLDAAPDGDVECDDEVGADIARELRLEEAVAAAVYGDDGAEQDKTRLEKIGLRTKLARLAVARESIKADVAGREELIALPDVLTPLLEALDVPLAKEHCTPDSAGRPCQLDDELHALIDVLDCACLLLVTRRCHATRLIIRALELWHGHQFVLEPPVRKADSIPVRLARSFLTARRVCGMDERPMFAVFIAHLACDTKLIDPQFVAARVRTHGSDARAVPTPTAPLNDVGNTQQHPQNRGHGHVTFSPVADPALEVAAQEVAHPVSEDAAQEAAYRAAADTPLAGPSEGESRVAWMRRREENLRQRPRCS